MDNAQVMRAQAGDGMNADQAGEARDRGNAALERFAPRHIDLYFVRENCGFLLQGLEDMCHSYCARDNGLGLTERDWPDLMDAYWKVASDTYGLLKDMDDRIRELTAENDEMKIDLWLLGKRDSFY